MIYNSYHFYSVVIDKTSGRGRGFGFCEFADSEYAANAVRSLNGTEFQGRVIRIDFSDSERAKSQTEANALRVGPNAIKATVNSINRRELLESLQDMQVMEFFEHFMLGF